MVMQHTTAMGSFAPGFVPAGTMTFRFRPAENVGTRTDVLPSAVSLTVLALRNVQRRRHRRDELGDVGRHVWQKSGKGQRLLDALVPERRRIDYSRMPRDRLRELQTKLANPVGFTQSMLISQERSRK